MPRPGLATADVQRVDFGYFVRPASETTTDQPRVEACLGYVVRHPAGVLVFDTGMGGDPEVDANYRPRRRSLTDALGTVGVDRGDVRHVVNCHLHFDHCGGNPELAGRPVFVQRAELEAARRIADYTLADLVGFDDARYEELEGESEILDDILVLPTPGHTQGHQSLAIRCQDGTVILAGQSHDAASDFGADHLALRAAREGVDPPLPLHPDWMERIAQLDPRRVLFAHDQAVWEPA